MADGGNPIADSARAPRWLSQRVREVAPLADTDIDVNETFFAGPLYDANIGWVNLGTGRLFVGAMNRVDCDNDGIEDAWEMLWFGNLATAGLGTFNPDVGATRTRAFSFAANARHFCRDVATSLARTLDK